MNKYERNAIFYTRVRIFYTDCNFCGDCYSIRITNSNLNFIDRFALNVDVVFSSVLLA